MIDSLGDRMKKFYEGVFSTSLPMRMPVIIRVDGKAFHKYTKNLTKPFDPLFELLMDKVGIKLCEEISGAQIAYIQSDEISILVHTYKRLNSEAWFANKIQKMASVSAGIASAQLTKLSTYIFDEIRTAVFDSRVFVLPEAEVNNYFIWR